MKRTPFIVFFLLATFLVADAMRAALERAIHASLVGNIEANAQTWLASGSGLASALAVMYAIVFFVAGMTIALFIKKPLPTLLSSLAVGSASPLSTLPFGQPSPTTWSTHAPRWLEVLFWANWYIPPIACAAGAAVLLIAMRQALSRRRYAA